MEVNRKSTRIIVTAFVLTLMISLSLHQNEVAAKVTESQERNDLSGINVAVYWGTSLGSVIASKEAIVNMYEWMNATVDVVNETEIKEGILDNYDILAMPGGNPVTFTNRFGTVGRAIIRDWVRRGGSYFGVCGGAMFATRLTSFNDGSSYYQLNLFNGTVMGPITGVSGMTRLNVNTSCLGPDLSGIASTKMSNYQGGGYYIPDEGQEMHTIASYDVNSEAGLIALACGTGTVCLSATHVEIEENSDRDGTDYYDDDYSDGDTEWDLMLQVSIWQIESSTWIEPATTTSESTTEMTNDTTPLSDSELLSYLPIIAVSGIIAVVIIIGVIFKRR